MSGKVEFSTRPHDETMKERLKDPRVAVEFLKVSARNHPDAPEVILGSLRHVANAQGMSWLAEQTGIARPALYQMLSKDGNPTILSFMNILKSLGIRMTFEPRRGAGGTSKPRRTRLRRAVGE
jgi:probable addiction module antidote protein